MFILVLAACVPHLAGADYPNWVTSLWSQHCKRKAGHQGFFDRSVLCKDAFTGQSSGSCGQAKPKYYKMCSCQLVRCVDDSVMTQSSLSSTDADPIMQPVNYHPAATSVVMGCLPPSAFDGYPPPSTLPAGIHDVSCKTRTGTRACYGGLAFFNVDLADLTGSGDDNQKCFNFCVSKGLDLSGVVDSRCRCGATPAMKAIWHHGTPRAVLNFDANNMEACTNRHIRVFKYTGTIVGDAIPSEMLLAMEQDTEYLDEMVDAEAHPMDVLDDENSDQPQDVTILANEKGYQRKCWPYPEQCGRVGPRQDIDSAPYTQSTPPAGVPDNWNKYMMVRYVFAAGVDQKRIDAFRVAADRWRQQTCINFVEQGDPANTNTFDVEVRATTQNTCSATLGMRLNKFRSYGYINLGWCNDMPYVGSMVHEIGHNLGMNHEQKRPDAQAAYVVGGASHGPHLRMFWQNIPAQWVPQYVPDDASYIGSASDGASDIHQGYAPYDYGSIMHYPRGNAFETIPPSNNNLVGNRQSLSAGDIKQVMDMYNCYPKSSTPGTTAWPTTTAGPTPAPPPPPTTTPARTTLDPSKYLDEWSCNFALGWCSFIPQGAWTRSTNGETPSSGTGPTVDHTTGTAAGSYGFVESSNPNFQTTSLLESSTVTLSRSGALSFWYHMFGSDMGTLEVQAKTATSDWTQLWVKTGPQQATQTGAWLSATVSIPSVYNQIRFRGTTSTSYRGDMSIDDVLFVYSGAVVPTTTSSSAGGGGGGGQNVMDCNFETDLCSWTETTPSSIGSAWRRRSGSTPSRGTGPEGDHTLGNANGFYCYVEASSPNYPQKTFTLATPTMALSTGGALTFWYHMAGTLIGELALEVKTSANGAWAPLWSKTGAQQATQGAPWKQAAVTIPQAAIGLQFSGTTAGSWSGDMAIDDIRFTVGAAPTPAPTTQAPTTTTLPPGFKCESTCQPGTSTGWWDVIGQNAMPKCVWWSCNGCAQCSTPPSKCIAWCNSKPFGGWKVHLHACQVFEGCKDCTFCGGSIAGDVAGDVGSGDARDEPGDEPEGGITTSVEASGGAGQISASTRSHQTMLVVMLISYCLSMV